MSKSQYEKVNALELDEFKRLYDIGASNDEEAVSLIIDRFSDRICRRLFTAMTEEKISYAEASHRFGLACLQNYTDKEYVAVGSEIVGKKKANTEEVSD